MICKENSIVLGEPTEEEKTLFDFSIPHQHLRDSLRIFKRLVHNEIKDGVAMLDVGCRDSANLMFFRSLHYSWYGVDLKPQSNNIIRGDMHDLPFGDEGFSLVFCCHTLEHAMNPVKALSEMKRVTHTNGIIFISTPAYCFYQIFGCDRTHITIPTMEQMKRWCYLAGLKIESINYFKNKDDTPDCYANLITICRVVN